MVKNLPYNAKDTSLIPGLGRSYMQILHADPTCRRATKPVYHLQLPSLCSRDESCNNWSPCALEPVLHNKKPLK